VIPHLISAKYVKVINKESKKRMFYDTHTQEGRKAVFFDFSKNFVADGGTYGLPEDIKAFSTKNRK